jgi:hypothetical protein
VYVDAIMDIYMHGYILCMSKNTMLLLNIFIIYSV